MDFSDTEPDWKPQPAIIPAEVIGMQGYWLGQCSAALEESLNTSMTALRPGLMEKWAIDRSLIDAAIALALIRAGARVYMESVGGYPEEMIVGMGGRLATAMEQTLADMMDHPAKYGMAE